MRVRVRIGARARVRVRVRVKVRDWGRARARVRVRLRARVRVRVRLRLRARVRARVRVRVRLGLLAQRRAVHALVLPERGAVEGVALEVVHRLPIDRRARAAKVQHGVLHDGPQPAAREGVAHDTVHQRLHRAPEELRLSRVNHPVPPAARLHARQRAEVERCGQAVRVEGVVERATLVVELLAR